MEEPNLEYLYQLSDNDMEFVHQILAVINEELPIELAQYQEMITTGQYHEAAQLVHKIKHKFIIVGLKSSYKSAHAHEDLLRDNNVTLHDEFIENVTRVSNFSLDYK